MNKRGIFSSNRYIFYDGWRSLLLLTSFSPSVLCNSDFTDVEGDGDGWGGFVGGSDVDDWGGFVGGGVSFDGVDMTVAGEGNERKGVHGWDHWNVT